MKPIIGIAGNEREIVDDQAFWLSYTAKNFVEGIQQAEGLPVILPIGQPKDAASYIKKIDKLLLGGGHDVSPSFYGEFPQPVLQATNKERDAFELALIKEAVIQGKPILGVCRGMQLLNVAFGGTLYQDLSLYPKKVLPHVQKAELNQLTHWLDIEPTSFLGDFLPKEYHVNSFHHQIIHQLAEGFSVAATATDGVIESIQSSAFKANVLGIQWHPELTCAKYKSEQQIFNYFVKEL